MDRNRFWQSTVENNFRSCFQVWSEVINGVGENLMVFGKFGGALDLWQQSILHNSGSFVSPHKGLASFKDKTSKAGQSSVPPKPKTFFKLRGAKKENSK